MKRYSMGLSAFTVVLLLSSGVAHAAGTDLTKARHELTVAIERAEQSLGEHQPGSGHTKQHMQQVLNVLEGTEGKHFNAKADTPGDGVGVMAYLMAAEGKLSPDGRQALMHARTFLEEAIEHAHRSVRGTSIEETHKHAALAAGLLEAAAGREQSRSPVTGALAYAARQSH
jgi:hypothetical protein